MFSENEGFRFQGSAPPPAKKTAGLIEKETVPFWRSFIQGFRNKKFQITKHKSQTNLNDQNSKSQTIGF
jgi:hypothetical protein